MHHFIQFSQLPCEVHIVFIFRVEEIDHQSQLWQMDDGVLFFGSLWDLFSYLQQDTPGQKGPNPVCRDGADISWAEPL